jgi:hypothetical protein
MQSISKSETGSLLFFRSLHPFINFATASVSFTETGTLATNLWRLPAVNLPATLVGLAFLSTFANFRYQIGFLFYISHTLVIDFINLLAPCIVTLPNRQASALFRTFGIFKFFNSHVYRFLLVNKRKAPKPNSNKVFIGIPKTVVSPPFPPPFPLLLSPGGGFGKPPAT